MTKRFWSFTTNPPPLKFSTPTNLGAIPSTRLIWDSRLWTLINLGETTTTLLPEVGLPIQIPNNFFFQLLNSGAISLLNKAVEDTAYLEAKEKMNAASPADLREANRRFQFVMAYREQGTKISPDIKKRTLSRWVLQFREAEIKYGCGYIGLLPLTQKRGNRTPKAPPLSRELLDTFIAEQFETPKQAPASGVYLAYQRACPVNSKISPLYQGVPSINVSNSATRMNRQKNAKALKLPILPNLGTGN